MLLVKAVVVVVVVAAVAVLLGAAAREDVIHPHRAVAANHYSYLFGLITVIFLDLKELFFYHSLLSLSTYAPLSRKFHMLHPYT